MRKSIFSVIALFLFIAYLTVGYGGILPVKAKRTLYIGSQSSSCRFVDFDENATPVYNKKTLKGECVYLTETQKNTLIGSLNAKLLFTEKGDDYYSEYYFCEQLSDYIIVKGKKVNLQVAYGKEFYTVGTPMIFSSF